MTKEEEELYQALLEMYKHDPYNPAIYLSEDDWEGFIKQCDMQGKFDVYF